MNYLAMSMDTCIRAAGTMHAKRRIRNFAERPLKLILYCYDTDVGLRLPPIVCAAIIFNATGESCTGRNWCRRKKAVSQCDPAAPEPRL